MAWLSSLFGRQRSVRRLPLRIADGRTPHDRYSSKYNPSPLFQPLVWHHQGLRDAGHAHRRSVHKKMSSASSSRSSTLVPPSPRTHAHSRRPSPATQAEYLVEPSPAAAVIPELDPSSPRSPHARPHAKRVHVSLPPRWASTRRRTVAASCMTSCARSHPAAPPHAHAWPPCQYTSAASLLRLLTSCDPHDPRDPPARPPACVPMCTAGPALLVARYLSAHAPAPADAPSLRIIPILIFVFDSPMSMPLSPVLFLQATVSISIR
ncbi:hypothetical protein GGX14DRAFT_386828 [Mycena pura]|uniref:Uncharacterized protein n=1 Tax=Mycena pura TaxID=153505 RepID=A0AAD6YQH5_9AGAR|nr:hypothetical protein GGX14DRAFT_386828 [Mycena pura]